MARLAGKALEYDMANTILEDSEPEREAEEALRKENKRKRREQKIKKKQEGGNQPEASNVIILSDSQGGSVVLDSTPKNVGQSILAISDTVVALPKVAAVPTTNAMGHDLPPSPCSEKIQNLLIQSSPISPVHGQIALSDNAPIDLDASTTELPERVFPGFNLARFAFDKQASALSKLGPSHPRPPLGTSSSEENIPTARAPKASKTPLPPFASSFTQSQLAALSKCIVCNLAWTARKTVPVKMTHIKSCARKNGWNNETITTGLTKEIGHLLPLVRNDGVRDSKIRRVNERGEMNKDDSYTPKTLLEDVVNEGAAKKRRKRGQDMDFVAVAHPQDAHAAIIQRAKTLLGPPKRFPDQTQDEANPSTQTFRPSRLGVSGTRVGILGLGMLEDQGTPAEMHVIPSNTQDGELKASRHNANKSFSSTQIFQPSALARRFPKLPIPYSDENTGLFDTHVAEGTRPLPMTQASSKEGLVTRPENIRPQPTPGMTDVHTLFQNTINPVS
ncbi:hypothetical protein K439DRAFT_1626837 [Ramaria rubella]|nr:hypothetical protein K439DRAFT_1626837 [Ramaria rubella]